MSLKLHLQIFSNLHTIGTMLYLMKFIYINQIRSDQSLSHVWLFATPWIAARQASLSITNSWSSLRLMSIESVMPSSHLMLCRPLLLLPPIPPKYIYLYWKTSQLSVALCSSGRQDKNETKVNVLTSYHLPLAWKWRLLSHVLLFATPWTIQSMEFSRPEYWSE